MRAYGPSKALQEITILLTQQETVNDILMGGKNMKLGAKSTFKIQGKNEAFPCGAQELPVTIKVKSAYPRQ